MGSNIEMIMRSIDVSSFLLFEGSADSEDKTIIIFKEEDLDDNDDDDAESCISHSPEFDTGGYETAVEDWPDDVAGSSPLDQKWSGEDQDEVVSGRRRRRGLGYYDGNEDRKKFKACLDSGFSEMEKNRLFWEACLTT
ncbi:uncharacterized protein LOC124929724 [Impatiens glandulifera]|uniref:uncharacterized protein LOC124929724 n=1 Tax=Impatiens glandulifera TaxID=253017 RepID=UPI001FB0F702|nr:uncharacterized protein LOC124929724 [Impatiens glandulifera]